MPQSTCLIDDCNASETYAKAMCRKHYKASRPRTPDKPKQMQCAYCGALVMKITGGHKPKYGITCSYKCRALLTFGWSERLPDDHMARCIGKSCKWPKPDALQARPSITPRTPTPTRTIECEWCGASSGTRRADTRFCSRPCKLRAKAVRRRGREAGVPGTYTWSQIVSLWLAFDRCCAYCDKPTDLVDIQAEHVQPISKLGANNLSNLLPACGPCNGDKRDLLLAEWAVDRQRRGLPEVRTTWSDDDKRYSHLTSSLPLASLPAA